MSFHQSIAEFLSLQNVDLEMPLDGPHSDDSQPPTGTLPALLARSQWQLPLPPSLQIGHLPSPMQPTSNGPLSSKESKWTQEKADRYCDAIVPSPSSDRQQKRINRSGAHGVRLMQARRNAREPVPLVRIHPASSEESVTSESPVGPPERSSLLGAAEKRRSISENRRVPDAFSKRRIKAIEVQPELPDYGDSLPPSASQLTSRRQEHKGRGMAMKEASKSSSSQSFSAESHVRLPTLPSQSLPKAPKTGVLPAGQVSTYLPGRIQLEPSFGLYAVPAMTAMDVLCNTGSVTDEQVVDEIVEFFDSYDGLITVETELDRYWLQDHDIQSVSQGSATTKAEAMPTQPVWNTGAAGSRLAASDPSTTAESLTGQSVHPRTDASSLHPASRVGLKTPENRISDAPSSLSTAETLVDFSSSQEPSASPSNEKYKELHPKWRLGESRRRRAADIVATPPPSPSRSASQKENKAKSPLAAQLSPKRPAKLSFRTILASRGGFG
jgi:hypothetical protein